MEIDDLAGVGVADPHVVNVVDRAAIGKSGQRGLDCFDAIVRGVGSPRQFRLVRSGCVRP